MKNQKGRTTSLPLFYRETVPLLKNSLTRKALKNIYRRKARLQLKRARRLFFCSNKRKFAIIVVYERTVRNKTRRYLGGVRPLPVTNRACFAQIFIRGRDAFYLRTSDRNVFR